MTECSAVQVELGAYVLGGLPDSSRRLVDEHVLDCPLCAAELSELEDAAELLGRISPADLTVDELARRRRRPRLGVLSAAAALVLAAAVGAGVVASSGHSARTFSASAGSIRLAAQVRDQPGGTALSLVVNGLPEDEHCRLFAVSTSGSREPAGAWTASYDSATRVVETSSFSSAQLASLELDGTDGTPLVTVPLR